MKKTFFFNGCIIGDEIWYSNCEANGLYKFNLKSGENQFCSYFPKSEKWDFLLHQYVCQDEEKLVFSPFASRFIVIYDMQQKSFDTYEVPGKFLDAQGFARLESVCKYGEKFFFLSYQAQVLILDMNKKLLYEDLKLKKLFQNSSSIENFGSKYIACDNKIYISIKGDNKIVEYDLKNEQSDIHEIKGIHTIYGITSDDKEIWVCTDQGIGIWKKQDHVVINLMDGNFQSHDIQYFADKLWLMKEEEPIVRVYSLKSGLWDEIALNKGEHICNTLLPPIVLYIGTYEDRLVFVSCYDKNVYLINRENEIEQMYPVMIDISDIRKEFVAFGDSYLYRDGIFEGKPLVLDIESFLEIMKKENHSVNTRKEPGSIGKAICKKILNETHL